MVFTKFSMLNFLLIGPQASGKGTQARLLLKKFNFFYLEMGSSLRAAAKEDTPLGREIDRMVNKEGVLAPDEAISKVLGTELAKVKKTQGILFDGFPRMVSQIKILDQSLAKLKRKLDLVIFLNLPDDLVFQRLSGRRVCDKCGRIYNIADLKTSDRETCAACGGKLIIREDDTPAKIKTRLALFKKETMPVVDFYRQKGILSEINGEESAPLIAQKIIAIIKEKSHDRN